MRSESQYPQFRELAYRIRHYSFRSESGYCESRNSAIVVQLYARLYAPHVFLLVEVPVGSRRISLSHIVPFRTVQGLPYLIKSHVVFYLFRSLREQYRYFGVLGHLVVFHGERCSLYSRAYFEIVSYRSRLPVSGVFHHLVFARGNPYK